MDKKKTLTLIFNKGGLFFLCFYIVMILNCGAIIHNSCYYQEDPIGIYRFLIRLPIFGPLNQEIFRMALSRTVAMPAHEYSFHITGIRDARQYISGPFNTTVRPPHKFLYYIALFWYFIGSIFYFGIHFVIRHYEKDIAHSEIQTSETESITEENSTMEVTADDN